MQGVHSHHPMSSAQRSSIKQRLVGLATPVISPLQPLDSPWLDAYSPVDKSEETATGERAERVVRVPSLACWRGQRGRASWWDGNA